MDDILMAMCRDEDDKMVLTLVSYIRTKGLKAGDKLPSIRSFASELNLSQSQVRSGFMRASALGLIKIVPRSGCYMANLGISELIGPFALLFEALYMNVQLPLFDLYELKTTLERGISKRVAKIRTIEELAQLKAIIDSMDKVSEQSEMVLLDEQFHNKLAECSRNPLFYSIINVIHSMLRESRMKYSDFVSEFPQSIKDHKDLYEALKEQDELLSGKIAERHSNRRIERLALDY
ncbi:FadR family transcriptional regulator [Oceanispirochaeta crateris]|uniref:FadR family transcriptional regulator n=1 Tax=Oceanispirochaeta crateris TaxID=2518645 RepID=A0A5C1QQ30_9SPIO|nr:FCD domain-containing protein [Oceanispirochaeta crateris]QEN09468.1 FadR family transcriptional regulator [Oceanispirochaeta crateris]